MYKLLSWLAGGVMMGLTYLPECQTQLYIIPATVASTYILLLTYPWAARTMHQRKYTYEDLKDMSMDDATLQRRFQIVFTRVQQLGGAVCAGIVAAYCFHVIQKKNPRDILQYMGILGGLISLYARLIGYVGRFCIACLHRMKNRQALPTVAALETT